jgi:hypothetical protein
MQWQWYDIVYAMIILALGLFLTAGLYILQRDRYWQRVWKDLGQPQVESIKELKTLSRKQNEATIPTAIAAHSPEGGAK